MEIWIDMSGKTGAMGKGEGYQGNHGVKRKRGKGIKALDQVK